jgi:rSAM/selenodomain-associated transferase 2/rSAM/selenodomain-associated transferase 1
MSGTALSIIVPALDEAASIAATLGPLQPLRERGDEVIVVDGGSRDATVDIARPLADCVLAAPRGRATQMNAGAAAASGDALLFLHADSIVDVEGIETMLAAVARGARWGRFRIAIEGRARILPLVAAVMNARSRLTGIVTGDMGIFVTRELFVAVGGYPAQPLMEDVELSRRLKRGAGRPVALRTTVLTSGRRWDRRGAMRTIFTMWSLRLRYFCGADPRRLAHAYENAGVLRRAGRAPTLLVFAKDPVAGEVKTRLVATLGAERAAALQRELAERTLALAAEARSQGIVDRVVLCCAPDPARPAFAQWRDRYAVELAAQRGEDLGARMRAALDAALACGVPALLIGTDCPALDVGGLAQAAAALDNYDAVFVPAEDGGYVLVGLARSLDAFGGIAWGTPDVMAATRAKLNAARATWRELPALWDVDRPQDVARWEACVAPVRAA